MVEPNKPRKRFRFRRLTSIGLLTPTSLHSGQAEQIIAIRKQTLQIAWQNNPECFVGGIPEPAGLPKAVWINPPKPEREMKNESPEANCSRGLLKKRL